MSAWNVNLYLQFVNERTQPSIDLIARLNLAEPKRIIDLGCGPGNSTAMLRRRWPDAKVIGLDSSPTMLAAAKDAYPNEEWILADIATWQPSEPFDLVFSNATLQWLPHHDVLYPHLFGQVAKGGALAVQIPSHFQSPFHRAILQTSEFSQWEARMEAARHAHTKETPAFYYDVLQPIASKLDIWETEYIHVLDSPEAILTWYRATGLRPFLEALRSDGERQQFEQMLFDAYSPHYPRQNDGRVLFPFRRLFLVAYH